MRKLLLIATIFFVAFQLASFAHAGEKAAKQKVLDPLGIQRLKSESGAKTKISISDATGGASFIGFTAGGLKGVEKAANAQDRSTAFFREHGSVFGLKNALAELKLAEEKSDAQGGKHLAYSQIYFGVPVFAGVIKTHFNAAGKLGAVNGNIIPEINVNPNPSKRSDEAAATALGQVSKQKGRDKSLSVRGTTLYVYRMGLLQGIPGNNHLVWEVEVGNGADVREFVYIDAHTGKFVDQITGIIDGLDRRAYDGKNLNGVPPEYPATPFWVEGDAFPTTGTCVQGVGRPPCNTEADNMLVASEETHDFFDTSFGRDSFDGLGGTMDSIFDRGYMCPNASWNGTFISFCPGLTVDDVTAHEWGHAYTQYTHGLIYAWQSGALNEAYSDIWGETVDRINNRDTIGNSATDPTRTAGNCSSFSPPRAQFLINSPASIAGNFPAQAAQFGPVLSGTGVTGNVVLAVDDNTDPIGGTDPNDGCGAITNGAQLNGNIALIRRGVCTFSAKVYNAQQAGAVAVLVFNNVPTGLPGMGPGVNAALVTIPSIGITQAEGNSLIANLATPPSVTMRSSTGSVDTSTRWLLGEDSTFSFTGALRDMYNPNCYSNPGKVLDSAYYNCGPLANDNGGVHGNSGIPNHAYALLVDGGTYNGQTINAIGLTKAAHIYYRAMTVYQNPASNFADHADALEQSADDLLGVNLADLVTGAPSGQIITLADVGEVHKATLAVELRTPPTFCNFQPILAQGAPALCSDTPYEATTVYLNDFESGLGGWTLTNQGVFSGWPNRNWTQATTLPRLKPGAAAFGEDIQGGDCAGGAGDISGVMRMESGNIVITNSSIITPRLAFDHYVATEGGWDGGNLKISINGGAFNVVPQAAFTFNPHNVILNSAAAGNTDPLAGQRAFSGTDAGSVGGSWGQTQVNLAALGVVPGNTIRLRYDMGMDGCTGIDGWYVDNVHVYTCELPQTPVCTAAVASPSIIKSNSHEFKSVNVTGVTDANGDSISININSIFQDEAVLAPNSGNTKPDGRGVGTSVAQVRAERVGNGNGRVYHIGFTASDGTGGSCTGEVTVKIPVGDSPVIDGGALFDSTQQ